MDQGDRTTSLTRLRHIQSISEAALAHLHFDDLVRELLERVTAILHADTAAVLLLEAETGQLRARAAKGLEEEVEEDVRVPVGQGFAGRIASERRTIVVPDVDRFDIYNPILRQKGLRSLVGAPLLVEGRLIGVMHVGTLVPRDFTAEDEELLQLAADRIAVAIDHSRLYESERTAAQQLARLEAITEAALAHLALDDLLDVLLLRLRDLVATDTLAVMLLDDDGRMLRVHASLGIDDRLMADVAIGEGFSGRVAASGKPMVLQDVKEAPDAASVLRDSGIASLIGVPLVAGGQVIGVLTGGTWDRRLFGRADVDLLERAAARIALGIENSRLYAAERAARTAAEQAAERIRRIESITRVAMHHISLDDDVLERLLGRVRVVLEADTAALFVTDDTRQVLVARAEEGSGDLFERDILVPIGKGFAGRVAELRRPLALDVGPGDVVSPLLRARGIRSLLGTPLVVEDRLLGVLHVGTVEQRRFTDEDRALLELAGERLAVALDHQRIYEHEHLVAETLQRSLLPATLPSIPEAELASRYLPGEGAAVGGDWYDVIPLPDGSVGLAMGDVVSHGVRAASVMGQLRNALRAYAIEGSTAGVVLQRLDAVVRELEPREMATLAYAVIAPDRLSLAYAVAGHPPIVLIGDDGSVTLLEEGRGPPLGALPDAVFDVARAELGRRSTLLLYTDGLVERRDMWIEDGLKRLVAEVQAAAGLTPGALLQRLEERLLGGAAQEDDVAMLAVCATAAAGNRLSLRIPADPNELAVMRQTMRRWLHGAGAEEDAVYDLLVATTEAAANAVEHAYGPADATFDVEARIDDRVVTVWVRDHGAWRAPRGHNRGRGTLLMQQLMDDFAVQTGDEGTEVRLQLRLNGHL